MKGVFKNKDNRNCFFCKKQGHHKQDCRKYKTWKIRQEKANKVTEMENASILGKIFCDGKNVLVMERQNEPVQILADETCYSAVKDIKTHDKFQGLLCKS